MYLTLSSVYLTKKNSRAFVMELEKESKLKHTPTCFQNVRSYFMEYCANTSIHGLKFLGEKKRNIFERIWWILFMVVSLYFCISLIAEAYRKWAQEPVVVSFATTETPVWEIPFPAITLCPQIKAPKGTFNFTNLLLKSRNLQKLSPTERKELNYMSLVCMDNWHLHEENNATDFYNGDDIEDFLMKVQPNITSIIVECYWLKTNCTPFLNNLFIPILTYEGICFTFNLFDRDELFTDKVENKFYDKFKIPHQPFSNWSLEKGYDINSKFITSPKRTALGGAHGGLDITLQFNSSDMDYLCGEALQGFKFILHSPVEFPFVRQNYFRVGINKDATVVVKPTIVTTAKQLKDYTLKQRKCYYDNEKQLKFFKVYDQTNCMHECLSNFTSYYCNCSTFGLLREEYIPVCGPPKKGCIGEAEALFLGRQIKINPKYHTNEIDLEDCNCLPSCSSLTFESEVTQLEWNWQEADQLLNQHQNISKTIHFSRVQIFYSSMQFVTSQRNELYGSMDFLASCGGLLGLFIGFSFISVIEIIYYLTLRFISNIYRFGRDYWAGKEEPLENEEKE